MRRLRSHRSAQISRFLTLWLISLSLSLAANYVAALGFEPATYGSAIRRATDCALEPGKSQGRLTILVVKFEQVHFTALSIKANTVDPDQTPRTVCPNT